MQLKRIPRVLAATGWVAAACTAPTSPSTEPTTAASRGGTAEAAGADPSAGDSGIYAPPTPWLDEDFNLLLPGGLGGQNGWVVVPGNANAPLAPDGSCRPVVHLDQSAPALMAVTKDVIDQASGLHAIEFDVKRDPSVTDASVAKLEVLGAVGGEGIKFQFIAGGGLRVSYGPAATDAAITSMASCRRAGSRRAAVRSPASR